jgi:two-component system NarL family response regulator
MIVDLAPDVVVLDVNMPGLNGFAVVESMNAKSIAAETVMLTMHDEEALFAKALSLGVRGYVLKESAVNDIVDCLHAVRRGQNFTRSKSQNICSNARRARQNRSTDSRRSRKPNDVCLR